MAAFVKAVFIFCVYRPLGEFVQCSVTATEASQNVWFLFHLFFWEHFEKSNQMLFQVRKFIWFKLNTFHQRFTKTGGFLLNIAYIIAVVSGLWFW